MRFRLSALVLVTVSALACGDASTSVPAAPAPAASSIDGGVPSPDSGPGPNADACGALAPQEACEPGRAYADEDCGTCGKRKRTCSASCRLEVGQCVEPASCAPPTPKNVSLLSAGWSSSCAVVANGKVKCWGENAFAQLGNGGYDDKNTAVEVLQLTGATSVSASSYHACAIASGGALKCWGTNNEDGVLAMGTVQVSYFTAAAETLLTSGVTSIATNYAHGCAVQSGAAKCWGNHRYGQLGNGDGVSNKSDGTPRPVIDADTNGPLRNVVAVATGTRVSCALLDAGSVKCWGSNALGGLGTGAATNVITTKAVSVPTLAGVIELRGASEHFCALLATGKVMCWGANVTGQVGDGTNADALAPVEAKGVANATALAVGGAHSCAVVDAGKVRCWGAGAAGRLGDGATTDRWLSVEVKNITGAVEVSAGEAHTCARLGSGSVECWGEGVGGRLGNGGNVKSAVPVSVVGVP